MKKVKFTDTYTYGVEKNQTVTKKGTVRTVTDKHADWLVRNKLAEVIEGKEEKEAAKRETK